MNSDHEQFLRHMAAAIEACDQQVFDHHISCGRGYFGDEETVRLVNEELPLCVPVDQIPTLLRLLTEDGFADVVESFCAELMQVAASNGMEIGVDITADREDDQSILRVSQRLVDWAEQHYPPHALQQCRPWLRA